METPALLDAYLRKAFSAVTRMLATRSIRCAIGRAHGVHVANIGMMFQFLKDHRDAASMKLMETPALLDAYLRKAFSAVIFACAIGRAHGVHVALIGMMFQFLKDHRKLFM